MGDEDLPHPLQMDPADAVAADDLGEDAVPFVAAQSSSSIRFSLALILLRIGERRLMSAPPSCKMLPQLSTQLLRILPYGPPSPSECNWACLAAAASGRSKVVSSAEGLSGWVDGM